MRRALVIAPNWIGDALMAQPLFSLLRKLHPRIVIDAVAPAWVAPVLERMPEIHDVYATSLAHGKLQMLRRWQLASDLRDVGYNAAYVLPNSLKSALIPWMAKIPLRIGYTGESRYGLLNVRHANPGKKERPPMVGQYAALAYAPGAKLPFSTDGREGTTPLPVPRLESDPNEAARVSARFNLETARRSGVLPGRRIRPGQALAARAFRGARAIRRAVVSVCEDRRARVAERCADRASHCRSGVERAQPVRPDRARRSVRADLARERRRHQRFRADARRRRAAPPARGGVRLDRSAPHAALVRSRKGTMASARMQSMLRPRVSARAI